MSSKLQITPSESGPRLRSWTAWWAIAKASAHRCKRDMAWKRGRGQGYGLGTAVLVLGLQSVLDCIGGDGEGAEAKATVLDCMVGDCEGICASLQA